MVLDDGPTLNGAIAQWVADLNHGIIRRIAISIMFPQNLNAVDIKTMLFNTWNIDSHQYKDAVLPVYDAPF